MLKLIADISAVNKGFDNKTSKPKNLRTDFNTAQNEYRSELSQWGEPKEIPHYSDHYMMCCKFLEAIEPHSEYGCFPHKLFYRRSPNQTIEELQYIKDNHKQVTLPVFMDLINTICRAFNDNNWAVSYNNKNDGKFPGATFQQYVENMPVYGSLENWMKFILTTIKLQDANGFIVIKPHDLHLVEIEDGGHVIDADFMNEPIPYYYSSERVMQYEENQFILIELEEKSMVDYQGKPQMKGRIYEFIDTENIFRITQVGKFIDYKFEVSLSFPHNRGYVPAKVLGGIPRLCKGKILYQSPFLYCVDLLDLVLMNYAYLQASINKCVYPSRVMVGDVCDFEDNGVRCNDGSLYNNETGKTYDCPSCHGSGLKSRVSPLGELLIRPATTSNPGDTGVGEFMKYVSPDTAVLEYLDKKIEKDENRARQILHMKTSATQVKGSENVTATTSAIDQKAQYAFIQTISDQIFEIYEWTLNVIGDMRYTDAFLSPSVTYPKSFDLQTDGDLMLQISEAIKAGLPSFVIHAIVYKFIKSLYYTDKKTADVYALIMEADRLLILSDDDIMMKISRGTAAKWEDVLHTSAIQLINSLEDVNPNFFEQDFVLQKEQLIEAAKAYTLTLKPEPIIVIE